MTTEMERSLSQARILVIDDNAVNVALLVSILEEAGYEEVVSVTDPREGLELFNAMPFDLVLLDIRMPHLDGHEVMARMREQVGADDYLPVIVLTAQTDPETRERALEAGARDFITKPFDQAEALHRIRNTLEVRALYRERADRADRLEEAVEERARELRHRELHLSGIMENAGDAIITIDGEGGIREFNRAAEETFGYSAEQARGMVLSDLLADPNTVPTAGTHELEARHRNGASFPFEATLTVMGEHGQRWLIVIGRDVTERKESERRLAYLARHDPITGLENRTAAIEHLNDLLQAGSTGTLAFLTLEGLESIADALGHDMSDSVSRAIGGRLMDAMGQEGWLAAWGGGDFLAVEPDGRSTVLAERLRNMVETPIWVEEHEFNLGCRIGTACFPADGESPGRLVQRAGLAMHMGNRDIATFSPEMEERIAERHYLERGLRYAVERGELFLVYQPKISLADRRIVGMEALVRWQHPERGLVSPGAFIPLAEETGLVVPIGAWVLETACRDAEAFRAAGLGDLQVAVNVSGRQFEALDLVGTVRRVLNDTGLPPNLLEAEVTETAIMRDVGAARDILNAVRGEGVSLAIDDFGTGYSSLGYLRQLPLDTLKIDQSFIRQVVENEDDQAIVKTILAMASTLNLNVVAEGIETEDHLAFLRNVDCPNGQGFLFSKPVPADQFRLLVQQGV